MATRTNGTNGKKKAPPPAPSSVPETPVPPPVAMTSKERLKQASQKAKVEVPESKSTSRAVLELTGEEAEVFNTHCAFKEAAENASANTKTLDGLVRPMILGKIFEGWIEDGKRGDNPKVVTPESSCTFVVQERTSRFRVPAHPNGDPKSFAQYAAEKGLPEDIIFALLKTDIKEKEIQVIASPDEIEAKHPQLAEKMRNLILEHLQPDEIAIVCKNEVDVSIEEGILDRAVQYAKTGTQTKDEQMARFNKIVEITNIVTPMMRSCVTSSAKYDEAVSMIASRQKVAGPVVPPKEFITEDKAYRLVVEGEKITIFKGTTQAGEKTCNDSSHATNTARKMLRDRAYLESCCQK